MYPEVRARLDSPDAVWQFDRSLSKQDKVMKNRALRILAPALLVLAAPLFAQSSAEVDSMKKDIQSIKDSQQAIQKDLQEIKKLLAARPQAPAGPADPVGVVIDVTGAPFKGDKNAKYTVVEFSEFQCPFCGRHVRDTYPQLDKEYIQPGKVKYVFLDFPLESIHKNAFKAAVAGNCAGEQGKFWEMHDRLFANQQQLEPAQLTEHAKAVGLDAAKFQQCLDSGKYDAEIRKDIAEGGKAGVTGTPTTVIGLTQPNGKVKILKAIRGAQQFASFKSTLDELLTPAKPEAAAAKAEGTR
jgi:protein-disulfide isomerase